MQLPPEQERFKSNAIQLTKALQTGLQKLKDQGYHVDLSMVMIASALIGGVEPHDLIKGFINNSHGKCWNKIKERDEDFFVMNAGSIFSQLPGDSVNLFKDLFLTKDTSGKSVISQNLKDEVWSLFDAMIKIAIKYIHKNRKMINNEYTESFYDDVDLSHHALIWKCTLI